MIWNERIKELRAGSRLTLKEIAKRLGVSEGTAQRYENNIKEIPYAAIIEYSKIFGVSPAYIMGWEDMSMGLSEEEKEIITAFRLADDFDRETVRRALGIRGKNNQSSEKEA